MVYSTDIRQIIQDAITIIPYYPPGQAVGWQNFWKSPPAEPSDHLI